MDFFSGRIDVSQDRVPPELKAKFKPLSRQRRVEPKRAPDLPDDKYKAVLSAFFRRERSEERKSERMGNRQLTPGTNWRWVGALTAMEYEEGITDRLASGTSLFWMAMATGTCAAAFLSAVRCATSIARGKLRWGRARPSAVHTAHTRAPSRHTLAFPFATWPPGGHKDCA